MLISRRIRRSLVAERDAAADALARALADLEAERLARVAAERYHAEETEGLRKRARSEVTAHGVTLEKLAATADMARMAAARHESFVRHIENVRATHAAAMDRAEEVNTTAQKIADAWEAEAKRWRTIAEGLERSRKATEAAEAAAERRAGLRLL